MIRKKNISLVGETVTIICVAKAFPAPNYMIFHNAMKLPDVVNGVKTINSANLSHDGQYECVANNSIGNVRATFNLTVNGKICVKTVLVHILWKGSKVKIEMIHFPCEKRKKLCMLKI